MQGDAPRFGGVRLGQRLIGVLYAMLVVSAALALWVRNSPDPNVPPVVSAWSPWAFLAFVLLFGFYRFGLVRAGRYPAAKAFFQVGAGILFFLLLLPASQLRFIQPRQADGKAAPALTQLLSDPNVKVRLLAAEVARHRPDGVQVAPALAKALTDRDPRVRAEAHRSLVALAGTDLGPPSNPEAVKAWRERYP